MKYLYLLVFAALISSCNRTKFIEFTGNLNGVNNGAFVIKDAAGNIIMSENVLDGKFQSKKLLPKAGFYNMFITGDIDKDSKKNVYDIYLDGGNYTVNAEADKLYLYPTIKTDSKIQNELSEYYASVAEKTHVADVTLKNLTGLLYDKDSPAAAAGDADAMQAQVDQAQEAFDKIQSAALNDFVTKNPQNEVAAHLLSQIDYKKDPASYYAVYQKFSDAQKKTDDGKTEGDDLKELAKLAAGAPVPVLAGTTPEGKPFDPKTINKKIILVEFWRSDVPACRANHKQLTDGYFSPVKNKDFTVVSVSLDTKKDAWAAALKENKMTWTQLSDLKGETSANMTNWMISAIPTYDLVDGNWHFIKRDVDFGKIPTEVAKYLKTTVASVRQ